MADLRGGAKDAPQGSKFFHFHAVFVQKNRSAHPLWELAPPPGKILDPPLVCAGPVNCSAEIMIFFALTVVDHSFNIVFLA